MPVTQLQRLRASAPVLAVVVVSGALGATVSCSPTGVSVVDHVLSGLLAAAVAWAATAAAPYTLGIGALALLVAGGNLPLHVLGILLVLALYELITRDRLTPFAAAIIGAVIVQGLLRLPGSAPERASAAVAAVGLVPMLASGAWRASAGRNHLRRRVFGTVFVLGSVVLIGALYVAAHTDEILDEAQHDARAGVAASREGDRKAAAADFDLAGGEFRRARHFAHSWWAWPGRGVPVVAPQIHALDVVSDVGAQAVDVARDALTRVDPDKLRFTNGRLDLDTVADYQAVFDNAANKTETIRTQLHEIPDEWLAPPVEHAILRFEKVVESAGDSARTADDALKLAPSLLGKDGPKTYFVAFVTPAEARGSGGLIANYGILRADHGRIHLDKVGPAPALDFLGVVPKKLTGLVDYQARYDKYGVANTWENVTMSPDFPTVAQAISQLYPQSGGTKIDGVIEVGPEAMAGLLTLTGPVHVPGLSFALDSQNVAKFLLHDEYTLVADQNERADLLGNIARSTFDKLTSGTSAQPTEISRIMSPVIRSQGMAFWLSDPSGQSFIERIGGDAAVPPVDGHDSFGATLQNAAGSKADYFMHRSIHYVTHVDGKTGHVDAQATLTLRNDAPSSGEPAYVIGNSNNLPLGTNRTIVSLYSPFALKNATIDGQAVALSTEHEFGRNVWSKFVDVPPGGTVTIAVSLSGSVDLAGGSYQFDYLPQVLPNHDSVVVDADFTNARVADATSDPGAVVSRTARTVTVKVPESGGRWHLNVRLRR